MISPAIQKRHRGISTCRCSFADKNGLGAKMAAKQLSKGPVIPSFFVPLFCRTEYFPLVFDVQKRSTVLIEILYCIVTVVVCCQSSEEPPDVCIPPRESSYETNKYQPRITAEVLKLGFSKL
jgi:hypothetical protein